MKKVVRIISAAVLSVAFVGATANVTQAQGACDWTFNIQNTGNGNVVTIDCEDVENVTFECVNNVLVGNISYQGGASGPATVGGSGDATSGSVTNSNGTTTQVGVSCGGSVTTSPTPTPSVSPSPSVTPTAAKPAVLPFTAGSSAESIIVVSLAAAAAIVALSRLAVAAYRRANLK